MVINSTWALNNIEKQGLVSVLTPDLAVLLTKVKISQEELANIIGVSRQTY